MSKAYHVYILASQKNGTLYIGMTNSLITRIAQHRNKQGSQFTSKNHVGKLVYYEEYSDVRDAIVREKRLKKWNRAWKINLIEETNPEWRDLYFGLNQ